MLSASLVIPIFSVLVAGGALYFSCLRKAKISAVLGPNIEVYHHDYEAGMSTGLVIPI